MSLSRRFITKGALLALSTAALSCAPEPTGQLMLAVQTDMSLPKDIDTIRIEVFNEGVPKFRKDFDRLGTPDGEIRLPGTLALLAPEKASSAITISISARMGGPRGQVRVVRQVVTTVPQDRVASLHIPLRFVCDGSGEDRNDEAVSTCPEGQTCIAGSCEDRILDSSTLPTYEEEEVFAQGSCFSAETCWKTPTRVDVDPSDCSIAAQSGVNLALDVEGDGICGPAGCFVTLDANSPEGWQTREDGRIALPRAVCTKMQSGEIVSVVSAPITATCPQKTLSLPTCGPWLSSAVRRYEGPRALAGGQARPIGGVVAGSKALFITASTDEWEGELKSVGLDGGKVSTIPFGGPSPRDIVASGDRIFLTGTDGTFGSGAITLIENGKSRVLLKDLGSPEGIAVEGNHLFWADFQSGDIFSATLEGGTPGGPELTAGEPRLLASFPGQYPYRLVADGTYLYAVAEGTAGEGDGRLIRIAYESSEPLPEVIASGLETPRALAIDRDGPSGPAKAIYFTTFAENGTVERVVLSSEGPQRESLASGVDHPSGITVDDAHVYFTTWGDGTVKSLSKTAASTTEPTTLVSGRVGPGAIFTTKDAVYWVDEGSSSKKTGTFVKLPKPTQ